jgi:signal transduction histidine kinase
MHRVPDKRITIGFVLSIIVFFLVGFCLDFSNREYQVTAQKMSRSYEVLLKLQEMVFYLTHAESSRRGYVINGDEMYVIQHTNTLGKLNRVLDEINRSYEPEKRWADWPKILLLIDERVSLFGTSITLRDVTEKDELGTQQRITDRGHDVMVQLQELVDRINAMELSKLKVRQQAIDRYAVLARLWSLVGIGMGVLVIVWGFRRLMDENEHKQQINKDLEGFSYSISHDLRAPLRHINSFARILQQEAKELLPENRALLAKIIMGAKRMDLLVEDLLSFSRTAKVNMYVQQFSMNDLVSEVISDITEQTKESDIVWQVSTLNTVCGDRILLKQVWINLISNAVKFTKYKPKRIVKIYQVRDLGDPVFVVSDNGVGFDPKSTKRLFEAFHRLHTAYDFEGTGIGLAIVKRIVSRHGGKVWAEGVMNEGATFYFSLPRVNRKRPGLKKWIGWILGRVRHCAATILVLVL